MGKKNVMMTYLLIFVSCVQWNVAYCLMFPCNMQELWNFDLLYSTPIISENVKTFSYNEPILEFVKSILFESRVALGLCDQLKSSIFQIKQDDEEFRVMYREGPKGTPYHTLLVEGFVDGPVDICKCYW